MLSKGPDCILAASRPCGACRACSWQCPARLTNGWVCTTPAAWAALGKRARSLCVPGHDRDAACTLTSPPGWCAGEKVPNAGLVGDMRLSYAKFLHLLAAKRIKRIIVYGDMRTAVVEVRDPPMPAAW